MHLIGFSTKNFEESSSVVINLKVFASYTPNLRIVAIVHINRIAL